MQILYFKRVTEEERKSKRRAANGKEWGGGKNHLNRSAEKTLSGFFPWDIKREVARVVRKKKKANN